jgi:hypothetical protein
MCRVANLRPEGLNIRHEVIAVRRQRKNGNLSIDECFPKVSNIEQLFGRNSQLDNATLED